MRQRRVLGALTVVGLSLAALGNSAAAATAPTAGPDLDKVTLTLNWVPYGEHVPFYYGVAQGIFEEHGIRLTIQPGGGSGRTVQATAAGQTDFGWADTPALLNGVAGGAPVKSLGVFLQTTPGSVEFFAEKGYTEPTDLIGATIAGTAGDAMSQTFPSFLAANGLTEADVTVQNVDAAGKIAALVSGQVDAILGFCHDQAPTIENISGEEVDCMRFADWGVNFYSSGLLTNQDLLDNDPDLAKRMLDATIASWEAAIADPEAAVEAMSTAVFNQAPPAEVLAQQFAETQTLLHTDSTADLPPGVNVEADWQATIDLFAETGGLENPGPPSDYWVELEG